LSKRWGGLPRGNQSSEEDGVDAASETDLAVDFYDGDALVEPLAEICVGVDVDEFWLDAMLTKQGKRIVAEMAALSRVEHDEWAGSIGCWRISFHGLGLRSGAGLIFPAGGPMSPNANVHKCFHISNLGIFLNRSLDAAYDR
jgi:hypothetical protein